MEAEIKNLIEKQIDDNKICLFMKEHRCSSMWIFQWQL